MLLCSWRLCGVLNAVSLLGVWTGPLATDNDTIVVALRQFTAGAPVNASFSYYAVSLDRRHPQDSSGIATEVFWEAVLEHAVAWDAAFAPGMKASLPYDERRQVDMAKGVLVATSTVFIGDQVRPHHPPAFAAAPLKRSQMAWAGAWLQGFLASVLFIERIHSPRAGCHSAVGVLSVPVPSASVSTSSHPAAVAAQLRHRRLLAGGPTRQVDDGHVRHPRLATADIAVDGHSPLAVGPV